MSDSNVAMGTPKNGSGDAERTSSKKRVPVPSSRKFGARAPPMDEGLKLKLKNAINEMEGRPHMQVTKARSVAEINPTKCKVKRRSIGASSADEVTIHATPRPLEDLTRSSQPGRCQRERLVCKLYQRLLLNAWRNSKIRLTGLSESLKRQKDQITQLEMQINLLKNLSKSEIEKRNDALAECQKTKTSLEKIENENTNLQENLNNLRNEINIYRKNISNAKIELRSIAETLSHSENSLKQQAEENRVLKNEIAQKDELFRKVNLNMEYLENTLNFTKNNLQNMESLYVTKQQEFNELSLEYEKKMDMNSTLEVQLEMYKEHNFNMEKHIEKLQDELADNISRLEVIKQDNDTLKVDIEEMSYELREEKTQTWWKNIRQIAILSLTAVDSAFQIMLPAYL